MPERTLAPCEAAADKNKENEILLAPVGLLHSSEIYRMFRGQQITFPVRFFNPLCIRKKIAAEYDGTNIGLLAKKYDYSEKTVRRFLKKAQGSENTKIEQRGNKK